ncbi:MAG TPA: hypothetical protein VGD54_07560 [Steroidobacteraceae bacterium]
MGAPVVRPFNALSGTEIRDALLSQIKRGLDNDHHFRHHLTYPVVTWAYKAVIRAYPHDPAEFAVELSGTILAPGAEMPAEDAPFIEIEISGDSNVTAPYGQTADAVRREAGIPVPTPRSVKGPGNQRLVVDAPPIDLKGAPVLEQEEPRANVSKGGKIFGRSVTAKTPAAPHGAEPAPPAGTKPGIEETQQILEKEALAPSE